MLQRGFASCRNIKNNGKKKFKSLSNGTVQTLLLHYPFEKKFHRWGARSKEKKNDCKKVDTLPPPKYAPLPRSKCAWRQRGAWSAPREVHRIPSGSGRSGPAAGRPRCSPGRGLGRRPAPPTGSRNPADAPETPARTAPQEGHNVMVEMTPAQNTQKHPKLVEILRRSSLPVKGEASTLPRVNGRCVRR